MTKVIQLREELGISQTELAIRAGLHPGALNRIERGVRPNQRTAAKLAHALNLSPAALFDDFATLRRY